MLLANVYCTAAVDDIEQGTRMTPFCPFIDN
jgi:hypothetical protein